MRLKEKDIQHLAVRMIDRMVQEKRFTSKVPIEKLRSRVIEVLTENFKTEAKIDEEANRMMMQFDQQIQRGEVDARKMFSMIKQKLAKERNFVL